MSLEDLKFRSGGYEEVYILGYNKCSALKSNRRFGGTRLLHLQGQKISKARNQHEVGSNMSEQENFKPVYTSWYHLYLTV
jgi:hypothetical protein